jgi:anti-sigma factor RsiW
MLNCKQVAARASALIDGELGMGERWQMRLHLAMCKGCAAFVRQMRITRDLTRAAAAEMALPSEGDDARIAAILAQVREGKRNAP